MTRRAPFLIALSLATAVLAQATTRPTTKAVWLSLASGEVRYTAPDGWNAVHNSDLSAAYKNQEGNAIVTLQVTPQQQPIPNNPSVAQSLARQILKAIRADLERSKAEILDEPRIERDPRFMIRIRDRIRLNGVTSDRLHLYRAMGYNLVQAAIDIDDQERDQVKAAFATGEELLAGAVGGKREAKTPTTKPPTPRNRT